MIQAKVVNGKLLISDKLEFASLLARIGNGDVTLEIKQQKKHRSPTQNNAMHLYFKLLSEAFQEAGLDARAVFKPGAEIPVTPDMIKELMWKPVMKMLTKKDTTTGLTTKQVGEIYEVMNRHIAEKFGISVPFPSLEGLIIEMEER